MNILMIDTSQAHLLLGLKKGEESVEIILPHTDTIGAILTPSLERLMALAHLSYRDLNQIRVGVGPGSYTGTRVGVALAESLGYGLGIPVIKLPSLTFFLKQGEATLYLRSKFNTAALLEVVDEKIAYKLIDCTEQKKLEGLRELKPKQENPAPLWDTIALLETKIPLTELLYFSLS